MPRPSRKAVLGEGNCNIHLTIRAHNRDFLFRDEAVKEKLYRLLMDFKRECKIKVYHYVIMNNHLHLVLYASETELLSRFMRMVFGALARFINKRAGRSGRVFGERARTPVIQDRRYLFAVMRYIDFNPVRAGMVERVHHYKWSSYRHYAFGEPDELIDDAPEYLELSSSPGVRRRMYQEMFWGLERRGKNRQPALTSWFFIGDRDWVKAMLRRRGLLTQGRKPPG